MATLSRSLALNPVLATATATPGDDTLVGMAAAETISGLAGNDLIQGLAGNDLLFGGTGNDSIYGGIGDDLIVGGAGNDSIYTGSGFDRVFDGNGADVVIIQGAGVITTGASKDNNTFIAANTANPGSKTLHYVTEPGGAQISTLIADLGGSVTAGWYDEATGNGFMREDLVSGFDHFVADGVNGSANVGGTELSETIIVNGGRLYVMDLSGGGGDDTIKVSYHQADLVTLVGGDGNDLLIGGGGGDELVGGTGNDTIIGGAFGDVSGSAPGNGYWNVAHGGDGDDLIIGGNDASYIRGNYLYGEAGNDTIRGGNQSDFVYGGDGNDRLIGGDAADWLYMSAGADRMSGGGGGDHFEFTDKMADLPMNATIVDFSAAEGDIIDMQKIDLNPAVFGHEALSFIGTSAFHGIAGELRYSVWNGNAFIQGDLTGDGVADFSARLLGITSLSASDFIL